MEKQRDIYGKVRISKIKRYLKRISFILFILAVIIISLFILYRVLTNVEPPKIDLNKYNSIKVKSVTKDFKLCKGNWINKNKYGLYEMYVEGSPFERGLIMGKLSKSLIIEQEKYFINRINELIPSDMYIKFLYSLIRWFNRNLDKSICNEYREEIYGLSLSASNSYSAIGSNYGRLLNYHSAHDIGHALQNWNLVGCTSFSVWNDRSKDSSLIIARNFDFYVGDDFAKNKILLFCSPDKGYKFMIITWGGMIGAVSGMNEKGLTVTINAARSDIPYSSATPISILAREILQYASNINDAIKIAEKRTTFVSESIMIGSAEDNKTMIIEKSPAKIDYFYSPNNYIVSTNHFQSPAFKFEKQNIDNIKETPTLKRYQRVDELIKRKNKVNIASAIEILRDQKGLKDKDIGLGNEIAINQLIAHHSIIFQPAKQLVWVSTSPFQLGEYICYDLKKVFSNYKGIKTNHIFYETDKTYPSDSIELNGNFKKFINYKKISQNIQLISKSKVKIYINPLSIEKYINFNPHYFNVYSVIGDYYQKKGEYRKAIEYYYKALNFDIPREIDALKLKKQIKLLSNYQIN